MRRVGSSIRVQVILVTILSLLALAIIQVAIDFSQQRSVLIDSERRSSLTLIRSVNNTINSVQSFINTLSDIEALGTRLAELTQLNSTVDFIAITDMQGSIIFHSDPTVRSVTVPEMAQLPPQETVLKDIPGFGQVYLTSLTFDSGELTEPPQYQIVVASAAEPISDQLRQDVLSSILVTVLFALAVAVIIILLLQYYFVRPIEQLTRASAAIEAGDLTQQVVVKQRNEIGTLATSFNSMTHQLANLINELEARVKERTLELEIARDQAELDSRAKSDFLSNMSHELRTPLNMVIGYTSSMLNMPQMYEGQTLPEIFRADVSLIKESGQHLLGLINDILDLSKIEAGKLDIQRGAVDLVPVLNGVIATSIGLIKEKPLQIRPDFPATLPLIWADEGRVRQILLNLMSNAVKYTETGSITLSAKVVGNGVELAVIDTGIGIPENALKSIFDRFEQARDEDNMLGTGLGLDISQRLARLHNSQIQVKSIVGKGSTFALVLPIASTAQLAEAAAMTQPSKQQVKIFTPQKSSLLDSRTLLLVESDADTRRMLRSAFESEGYVIIEASDGKHAIEMTKGLLPEVVLLDVFIGGLDGWQVLETLKQDEETKAIPVVVISSVHDPLQAGQRGAALSIPKPIDLPLLVEKVNSLFVEIAAPQ